uniref:Putative salivary kunitz domain protein n=1 Tax=Ixodes ricinus TaxID=34613 RepID=A0A0K8RBM8_IXORI
MKTTIAALCFLAAALCVSALLPEEICRAPHAISSCAGTVKVMWYFDGNSNKCESYSGMWYGVTVIDSWESERNCRVEEVPSFPLRTERTRPNDDYKTNLPRTRRRTPETDLPRQTIREYQVKRPVAASRKIWLIWWQEHPTKH